MYCKNQLLYLNANSFLYPKPLTMEKRSYSLRYTGNGGDFFKIWFVNAFIQVITLGLYYPWAKVANLKYLYSQTEWEGSPFQFLGTGRELFIGFIKAILLVGALYGAFFYLAFLQMPIYAFLVFLTGFALLIPLALHGTFKYRMSRTSWRGIRAGYRGDRGELFKLFITGFFLTIVTLGIYGAWFVNDLRTYIIGNLRLGNSTFQFKGKGTDFFLVNFLGYLLTLVSLGIYFFWWQKDLFEFFVNNLKMKYGDQELSFKSKATGGGFFNLIFINLLLIIFTLGLATPWVVTRTMVFVTSNIEPTGDVDFDALIQTEGSYTDAIGEDMADIFDLDIAF